MSRKSLNKNVEADIIVDSRRRCCICFGLHRDLSIKTGQIAHLDRNNSNNDYDNLAFLCFAHHDQYDSKTSQSKNFTITEVKRYRKELKEKFITIGKPRYETIVAPVPTPDKIKNAEIFEAIIEILTETGATRHITHIASKIGLSRYTIEKCLNELANYNRVRIDRKRGTIQKTYSLVDSNKNLIIDAFIRSLGNKVILEQRYIRINQFEIDALIRTEDELFVVDVKMASNLSSDRILSTLEKIKKCRYELKIPHKAKNVLLIGVNNSVEQLRDSLKDIENMGVLVKFIEIHI